MPMSGNQKPGSNIKSFPGSADVQKGSDCWPNEPGQLPTRPVELNIKDSSRTHDTSAGVQK